jgi:hypothetical protein
VKYSYNRITLLWHQRSICFMVLGGMDAPVFRYEVYSVVINSAHYYLRVNGTNDDGKIVRRGAAASAADAAHADE